MTKSTGGSESGLLKQFMDSTQSTHKPFVSNSVGMALLHLSNIYLSPDAKELEEELKKARTIKKEELTFEEKSQIERKLALAKLDIEYNECVRQLKDTQELFLTKAAAIGTELKSDTKDDKKTDAEIRQHKQNLSKAMVDFFNKAESIKNIIKTTEEGLIQNWDELRLYLPANDMADSKEKNYQYVEKVFPLKSVLTLIWKGLHDDSKFIQHYKGSLDEKLKSAHKDQEERLRSFYNTIDRIRIDRICHTGNRNDLVLTLNQTYEGIDIVEDDKATILKILKAKIDEEFWEKYKDKALSGKEKEILQQKLFKWMESNNATEIFYSLKEKTTDIVKSLEELFRKHGSNPDDKEYNVKSQISSALEYLEFSCHPKENPVLYKVNNLLNFVEDPLYPEKNAALVAVKHWLYTKCDMENENDKKIISEVYLFFNLHSDIAKAASLLRISGNYSDDFDKLSKICEEIFKKYKKDIILQNLPLADKIAEFYSKYDTASKDNMKDYVENFFTHWKLAYYEEPRDTKEMTSLLSTLYSSAFSKKIILNDADIKKFFSESKLHAGEISMDPYVINRMFLNAFITSSNEWSEEFYKRLKETMEFVEKPHPEDSKIASDLNKSSYTKELRDQIKYLINKKTSDHELECEFPYIPTPETCQSIDRWRELLSYLNEDIKEKIYSIYKLSIVNQFMKVGYISVSSILNVIPKTQLSDFLLRIEKFIVLKIKELDYMARQRIFEIISQIHTSLNELFSPQDKAYYLLRCIPEMFIHLMKDPKNLFQNMPVEKRLDVMLRVVSFSNNIDWLKDVNYQIASKLFNFKFESRFTFFKAILEKEKDIEKQVDLILIMLREMNIYKVNPLADQQKWELFLFIKPEDYIRSFKTWGSINKFLIQFDDKFKVQFLKQLGESTIKNLSGAPLEFIDNSLEAYKILENLFDLNLIDLALSKQGFVYFKSKLSSYIPSLLEKLNENQLIMISRTLSDLKEILPDVRPKEVTKLEFTKKVLENIKRNTMPIVLNELIPTIHVLAINDKRIILKPYIDDLKNEDDFLALIKPIKLKTPLRDEKLLKDEKGIMRDTKIEKLDENDSKPEYSIHSEQIVQTIIQICDNEKLRN